MNTMNNSRLNMDKSESPVSVTKNKLKPTNSQSKLKNKYNEKIIKDLNDQEKKIDNTDNESIYCEYTNNKDTK